MRQRLVRLLALLTVALLALPAAQATCGGGGGGGMGGTNPRGGSFGSDSQMQPKAYVVPWKVLSKDQPAPATPVTLYWFPSSPTEAQGSDLLTSRMLTLDSAQCVGMQIVPAEDAETLGKYEVTGKLPAAVLVSDGKVVGRVDNAKGQLALSDVENLVHHELFQRETAVDALLDEGKKKADANDKDAAIAAYQKAWDQRCLVPKRGRDAQKALRRLGVTVSDANLRSIDPVTTAAMNAKMTKKMNQALGAELLAHYATARTLYKEAAALDPADPVPARYLGELYRHHTGEWTLATKTFEQLLTIQPDPLSRAVALHGLGKITIHMGDSAKGLSLFEQSVAVYPLALTYRNMAVYWSSERQRNKADSYVKKALAIDPDDGYNLIFAATYLVDSGRKEEALKIAKANENVLAASYNLAAIYALLGEKGKAMDLLKRHFYQYERYDAVRAMEMWEARVDYVFASMKDDPEFIKLTYMAK
jgi:tetratricopeptide (TPR) repeat protein